MKQKTLMGSTVEADKNANALMDLMAEIFTTPVKTRLEPQSFDSGLQEQAVTERFVRLMKLARSEEKVNKQAKEKVLKLTDAEKLAILSNASLKAPLSHDAYKEMCRLFYNVKGEEMYKQVFGDDPVPSPPYYDFWKGR